jgi:copper homeostasis protein CutC
VRAQNAEALVRETGVTELHSRTPVDAEAVRTLILAANAR